jgi:hypothetical protein
MLRRLRIAASAFFALSAIAVSAFWVRSYIWDDNLFFNPFGTFVSGAGSGCGRVAVAASIGGTSPTRGSFVLLDSEHISNARTRQAEIDLTFDAVAGFGVVLLTRPSHGLVLVFPDWFVAGLLSILAIVSWRGPAYRFSLRTLLIATTVLAVVFGVIALTANR